MEVFILVIMLTGWLTLLFAAGCALETAAKVLKEKLSGAGAGNEAVARSSSPAKQGSSCPEN